MTVSTTRSRRSQTSRKRMSHHEPAMTANESEFVRIFAYSDDAAGNDRLNVKRPRPRDEIVALRPWIQPHFRNLLAGDLVDHLLADLGRHIERGHVNGARHVENGGV